MKPSQEVMKYLRGRNGTGPEWNADWDVRISVLQELDKLSRFDPREKILSNAYSELLKELRATAKADRTMRVLGEEVRKLLAE
jgi:hypothetical protein